MLGVRLLNHNLNVLLMSPPQPAQKTLDLLKQKRKLKDSYPMLSSFKKRPKNHTSPHPGPPLQPKTIFKFFKTKPHQPTGHQAAISKAGNPPGGGSSNVGPTVHQQPRQRALGPSVARDLVEPMQRGKQSIHVSTLVHPQRHRGVRFVFFLMVLRGGFGGVFGDMGFLGRILDSFQGRWGCFPPSFTSLQVNWGSRSSGLNEPTPQIAFGF